MNPPLVATAPAAADPVPTSSRRTPVPVTAVEDAIAILARRMACTAEEAFAVLRTTAHDRRIKLRDVAQEVVASIRGEAALEMPRTPAPGAGRESYWD